MIKTLRELWGILKSDPRTALDLPHLKRLAAIALGWLMMSEFMILAEVYPTKWFFDEIAGPGRLPRLFAIAAIVSIAHFAQVFINTYRIATRRDFFWRFWALIWNYAKWRELHMDVAWHLEHPASERQSTIDKNMQKIEGMVGEFLFEIAPLTMRVLLTCSVMFFIDRPAFILLSVTMALYLWMVILNEKAIGPLRKAFKDRVTEAEKSGTELTLWARIIKQMGREREMCDLNNDLLLAHCEAERTRIRHWVRLRNRQEYVLSVSRGLLFALIAATFSKVKGIGYVALVTSWMNRSYSNFERISAFQFHIDQGGEALRELVAIMKIEPRVVQPENPLWPENPTGRVEFKGVSFSYPNGKQGALSGISLIVEPNHTVAIVGRTGCGKSTFASLLQREFDPTEGCILVDGIPLIRIDYIRYRQEFIGIVPQDLELFDRSVRENIRVADPDGPLGAEVDAARRALIHDFIERELPDGYDTGIGERGSRLSGGQRQRIALARALYKNPRILVLDEATSSLDAETQAQVKDSIDSLMHSRSCTVFVIAHRLSTVMNADHILVMEDGRIAAIGTHEELLAGNGFYRRLCEMEGQGILAK